MLKRSMLLQISSVEVNNGKTKFGDDYFSLVRLSRPS